MSKEQPVIVEQKQKSAVKRPKDDSGPKRPYIVTEAGIFLKVPDGTGDALQGSHRRVAVGETLMLTPLEARNFVNKILTPREAVARRVLEKAQAEAAALGITPKPPDDGPVEWPSTEPQLPSS
jgi:hypothetical protein